MYISYFDDSSFFICLPALCLFSCPFVKFGSFWQYPVGKGVGGGRENGSAKFSLTVKLMYIIVGYKIFPPLCIRN